MAKQPNYLLGYGERLTEPVEVKSGPQDKKPPYSFLEARERVSKMLVRAVDTVQELPQEACPGGQVVVSFTLHPEYYAKSYYPGGFFQSANLRSVGSKACTIKPEKRSPTTKGEIREPEDAVTTELFIAGARSSFERLSGQLPSWTERNPAAKHLTAFERISGIDSSSRIHHLPSVQDIIPLEVVLHASESVRDRFILKGFREYLSGFGLKPDLVRTFYAGGLCFLRMHARPDQAEDIARFSFLRTLREMPRLRTTTPILRGSLPNAKAVTLPSGDVIDPNLRIAVFDGGVPKKSPLRTWVNVFDVPGIGPISDDLSWHGETVTSAVLFGSADADMLERPYAKVDHYRVLDVNSETDPFELFDVLERITSILDTVPYQFINLSLGPTLPIDDDDVHAWTAVLDERLSEGQCLTTIAAGNTGREPDTPVQPWRIQVPSDCVNGLTVGSSDRRTGEWNRADYSSRGPGRSPGIVKPDLIAFGGSRYEPFWVCDPQTLGQIVPTAGTSYSAPATLRMGAVIRAHFGSVLSPLALKALLIHSTNDGGRIRDEVGWGKLPENVDELVVCPDSSARIVYQDEIGAAKYRRIKIPLPRDGMNGMVTITATFCFATEVDPEHPGNYTRSGLTITFRPDITNFKDADALHSKSESFFKPDQLYPFEHELRRDAHKWETCLHRSKRKQYRLLNEPVFDIHYNSRVEGHGNTSMRRIRYVLVITVEAPKVKDFYNRVVRTYRAQLQPLNPIIQIPVRT